MKRILTTLTFILSLSCLLGQNYFTISPKLKIWVPDKVAIRGILQDQFFQNVDTSSFRDVPLVVKYSGQKANGMPEGVGKAKYSFPNRKKSVFFIYEGTFKNGCPNGEGKMTFLFDDNYTQNYYQGTFVNGYFEGEGVRVKLLDGVLEQRWEGTFHLGVLHGSGTYARSNIGDKPYRNALWAPTGNNLVQVGETAKYDGQWVYGKKDGKGFFKGVIGGRNPLNSALLGPNDSYNGTWKDDVPNGIGTFTIDNATTYTGKVVDGKRTGVIRATYMGGDYSIGTFNDENQMTKGSAFKADTLFFDGDWVDNHPNGLGYSAGANGMRHPAFYISGVFLGSEIPLTQRRDTIPSLNRSLYKEIKYVDLYQFAQEADVQSVMNNTALVTSNGEYLNLANLNMVKFGGVSDYLNNVQSVGFRYDAASKRLLWTDYLQQKEKVIWDLSTLKIKLNSYTMTPNGLFLICRFDNSLIAIVSALTGKTLSVFQEKTYNNENYTACLGTQCFISPDNKYLFLMELSSESKGGYGYGYTEISVKLTTYDLMTKTVLASMDMTTRKSEPMSIYFLNPNQAFVSYFGGLNLNGNVVQGNSSINIDKTDFIPLGNDVYAKKDYPIDQRMFPKEPDLIGTRGNGFISRTGFDYVFRNYKTYIQSSQINREITKTSGSGKVYPYNDLINSKYQEADEVYQYQNELFLQDSLLMVPYAKFFYRSSVNFFRIFNIPNYLADKGQEKVLDFDTDKSSINNASILQGEEQGKKMKDFYSAITKKEFIYIADANGRTAVDWMNSRDADDFRQFNKYHVFVGGTLHNQSDRTYKVKVKVVYHLIRTTSLAIFSDDVREDVESTTYVEVKPGETVPYLCCLKDVNSGYYIKSTTLGQTLQLADPAYKVRLEMFEGDITPETKSSEDKLIHDFLDYRNIETGKSFFDMDLSKTELNVYYALKEDVGEITFNLKGAGSFSDEHFTTKKEYTGYKAHFLVDPKKKYTLTFLNNSIVPVLKPGVVQMYIDKDGGVTYEFKDK